MAEKEKFYITTAIAYTSRKPHIGNSYETDFGRQLLRVIKKNTGIRRIFADRH